MEIKMFNVNKNAREQETVDYVQGTVDWMEIRIKIVIRKY